MSQPALLSLSKNASNDSEELNNCPYTNANNTLKEWEKKCNELIFIYNAALENYDIRSQRFLISAFVLGSIATLVGSVNVFIPETANAILVYGFKIAVPVIGAVGATLSGVLAIAGWQTKITDCRSYLDLVQAFRSQLVTEYTLPESQRTDPNKFLVDNRSKYETILGTAPDIPHSYYLKKYEEYLTYSNTYSNFEMIV